MTRKQWDCTYGRSNEWGTGRVFLRQCRDTLDLWCYSAPHGRPLYNTTPLSVVTWTL